MSTGPGSAVTKSERKRAQSRARGASAIGGKKSILTLADEANRYRDGNGELRYRNTDPRTCGCERWQLPHRGQCLKCGRPLAAAA